MLIEIVKRLTLNINKKSWCLFHSTVTQLSLTVVPVLILNSLTIDTWMILSILFTLYLIVFATTCSLLQRHGEHLCPHRDVFLLRPGCHRSSHAEVPVVEEIPHVFAAGECLLLCMKRAVNVRTTCLSWSEVCFSRCSLCCSSCTRATTFSQSATSRIPWTCWWLVTASPSSSSSVTSTIRATSTKRSRNKFPVSVVFTASTRGNNMPTVWRVFFQCVPHQLSV